ncbi:MAG TPA: hypothetical protein VGM98_12230 [Schlesneria sp.]
MESRFTVAFFCATEDHVGAPSFIEIEPPAAGELARMMSKAEIVATWEQIKYKYAQQIIVVTDGKIIACSTFAVTVPRELVWLYDSAQDRLDAKIAHLKN